VLFIFAKPVLPLFLNLILYIQNQILKQLYNTALKEHNHQDNQGTGDYAHYPGIITQERNILKEQGRKAKYNQGPYQNTPNRFGASHKTGGQDV
jgi:hypothetical protein